MDTFDDELSEVIKKRRNFMTKISNRAMKITDLNERQLLKLVEEVKSKEMDEKISFITYIVDTCTDDDIRKLKTFFMPFKKELEEISRMS